MFSNTAPVTITVTAPAAGTLHPATATQQAMYTQNTAAVLQALYAPSPAPAAAARKLTALRVPYRCRKPAPVTYTVLKPGNAAGHVGKPLSVAITLILQLLPIVQGNLALLPGERHAIMQLLLQAAYKLQVAAVTPLHLCKIGLKVR